MTQWQAEKRTELHKTFGSYVMVPQRSKDGMETAYLVTGFTDGREVRVLPDPVNSAQKRARTITVALNELSPFDTIDADSTFGTDHQIPFTSLVGALALAGLTWEVVGAGSPLEEWLAKWFVDVDLTNPDLGKYLIDDLDHAGWTIVEKA